jgi:inosose dehydratase
LDFISALRKGIFCALGTGMVDFSGLLRELRAESFSGPIIVEQDRDPRSAKTPLEDAKKRLRFLIELGY